MEQARNTTITTPAWDAYRVARLGVLLLGPVVAMALAARIGSGVETASIETALMLLWSPLFFSIPALLLQHDRDAALPLERNFLVRGVKLLPYLLSKQSPIRAESIVSTVMWLWMLVATWDSVTTVTARVATNLLG